MNNKISFIKILRSISEFPDDQIEKIFEISHLRNIPKHECYIREGEVPVNFAFVISGLFRYCYIDSKGNEFTKGFFPENSFISSYSALIQRRESYFTVEALEDSSILDINYSEWKKLFEKELCWHKFLISLLEKGYCTKETREREFLLLSAEERYRSFLSTYPGICKRIKQNVVASYLGITPVALSRIRKKVS